MLPKFAFVMMPLAAISFSGSACAMTSPSDKGVQCRVVGGDKLPADSGGADGFCAAIAKAAAAQVPGQGFTVEARVLGASEMSATVTTADGRQLPVQDYSISDRGFSKVALDRFAKNLVAMIAGRASR
jgi:hypothetical protein